MAQSIPLRERILKAAGELFLANGFHRVTLLDIVSRARTSKSSIYKYFKSKEHLVATLVEQLDDIIRRQLDGVVQHDDLGFEQKLDQVTRLFLRLAQLVSPQFEADLREQLPDLHQRYVSLKNERVDTLLRPLFRQGLREEVLRRDVSLDILLAIYLQDLDMAIQPQPSNGLSLDLDAFRSRLNTLFLEGALEP